MMLALRASRSIASVEKTFLHQSNSVPEVKFFNILIGWMLANAGDATQELNLSQLQHHCNACNAMLVPASYCIALFT